MIGYYKNKECKIIGQNFYNYLICYLDKRNKEVKEIVPKGKVEIFIEEKEEKYEDL